MKPIVVIFIIAGFLLGAKKLEEIRVMDFQGKVYNGWLKFDKQTKLEVGSQFRVRGRNSYLRFEHLGHKFEGRSGDFAIEKNMVKKDIHRIQITTSKGSLLFSGNKDASRVNLKVRCPKVSILVNYRNIGDTEFIVSVKRKSTLLYVRKGKAKIAGKIKKLWAREVKAGEMIEYVNANSKVVKAHPKTLESVEVMLKNLSEL